MYATTLADGASNHCTSSIAIRTAAERASVRIAPNAATAASRGWTGASTFVSRRRSATASACCCGTGKDSSTSASTCASRSMIAPKARRDSSSAGRQERTWWECSCAARTAARQSVVLPMPIAPSSRRLRGPAGIPATNSRIVVSSASRPITLDGGMSKTDAISRVSRAPCRFARPTATGCVPLTVPSQVVISTR